MEISFPTYYGQKDFTRDWIRLRGLLRKRDREALSENELGEVPELRRRLQRIGADTAMLLILESRKHGGYSWF